MRLRGRPRERRRELTPPCTRRRAGSLPRFASVAHMYIGAHLSSAGGIHTAVDRAEVIGAESLQVFTQSPRTWRATNHDPANFEKFRERRKEVGLHGVLCHALYLCNFAATDDAIYEKSVIALRTTMEVACGIGADGVVFHVGSHLVCRLLLEKKNSACGQKARPAVISSSSRRCAVIAMLTRLSTCA